MTSRPRPGREAQGGPDAAAVEASPAAEIEVTFAPAEPELTAAAARAVLALLLQARDRAGDARAAPHLKPAAESGYHQLPAMIRAARPGSAPAMRQVTGRRKEADDKATLPVPAVSGPAMQDREHGDPAMAAMLDGRIVCAAGGGQPRGTRHDGGAAAGKPGRGEPR